MLVHDSKVALERLITLRRQLYERDSRALLRCLSDADHYEALADMAKQLPAAWLESLLQGLGVDDPLVPAVVWLAVLVSEQSEAVRVALQQWLTGARPALEQLTHCAVDDGVVCRLAPLLAGAQQLRLSHSPMGARGLMALLDQTGASLVSLHLEDCGRLEPEALVAVFERRLLPNVQRLSMTDMNLWRCAALWALLPSKLEELDLRGCARLGPWQPGTALPCDATLHTLKLSGCVCITLEEPGLAACLPRSLRYLEADAMSAACAAVLPERLQSLVLSCSMLTGAEFTLSDLRQLRLGEGVTHQGLRLLCESSPLLEQLDLSHCRLLTDTASVAGSLVLLRQLHTLSVHACPRLSDKAVVAALLESGARLRSVDTQGAWLVTSAELVRVLDLQLLTKIAFSAPREPLFQALRRCVTLREVVLYDCPTLSDEGWGALCAAAPSIHKLSLASFTCVDDDMMERLLVQAQNLSELMLDSMPRLKGTCLASPAVSLAGLLTLQCKASCTDEAALLLAVRKATRLQTLKLELSGESDGLLKELALHCKGLRHVLLHSPGKQKTLLDLGLWIPRMPALRSLVLSQPDMLVRNVVPLLRCQQLHSAVLYGLFGNGSAALW